MRARTDRDITVGRKDNGEGGSVGSGNGGQRRDDRVAREDRDAVNGDNVGADVFATDVANASGRGAGDDAREISAPANMASRDFKTKGRMVAFDGLRDGVETVAGRDRRSLGTGRSAGTTPSGDRRRRACTFGGASTRLFIPSLKREHEWQS